MQGAICIMPVKLSLVIPVYNVEKYLARCLNSCINQTLEDIEILCINDCSKDGSKKILEKYAGKDSRIKIINHDENKGLGAARNTGISYSSGEYVWFIDSDDYIAQESCQILYDTAKKNNVDVLTFCGINVLSDVGKPLILENSNYFTDWPHNKVFSPKECQAVTGKYFPVTAWHYITKRSVISDFRFRAGCYYEDTDFTPILFYTVSSVLCICYTAYFRQINPDSITQTPMTIKKHKDRLAVVISLDSFLTTNNVQKKSYIADFTRGYARFACKEIIDSPFYDYFLNDVNFTRINSKYNKIVKKTLLLKILNFCKRIVKSCLPYGLVCLFQKML